MGNCFREPGVLNQIVSALISPLGTSLFLAGLALALGLMPGSRAIRRLQFGCALLAFGWLWLWSMPLASEGLRGWLEDRAGPRSIEVVPQLHVMVVLGGGVRAPQLPRRPDADLDSAADRVWHAARLFHAGKANIIILSGGNTGSWDGSEAEAMRLFLLDLGVPDSAMVLETGSGNTRENASQVSGMLARDGVGEIILVTSALHMRRARHDFESKGLKVFPAPSDFEVIDMPFDLMRVLPDTRALNGSARAMKELVGRWLLGGD